MIKKIIIIENKIEFSFISKKSFIFADEWQICVAPLSLKSNSEA